MFWVCDEILQCDHSNENSTFLTCCLLWRIWCSFFLTSLCAKSSSVTTQMKAIEQSFLALLFVMVYMVTLTF